MALASLLDQGLQLQDNHTNVKTGTSSIQARWWSDPNPSLSLTVICWSQQAICWKWSTEMLSMFPWDVEVSLSALFWLWSIDELIDWMVSRSGSVMRSQAFCTLVTCLEGNQDQCQEPARYCSVLLRMRMRTLRMNWCCHPLGLRALFHHCS